MAVPLTAGEFIIKSIFSLETRPTAPVNFFVALHTADPGASGDSNEVDDVTEDTAYVRKAVAFDPATDTGVVWYTENTADVVFDAAGAGASYTATHVTVKDAVTAGNTWAVIELASPRVVVEGDIIRIPINELRITGGV